MNVSHSTFPDATIDAVAAMFPPHVPNGNGEMISRADVDRVARAIRMGSVFHASEIADRSHTKPDTALRVITALCEGHGVVELNYHGSGHSRIGAKREFLRTENPDIVPLFRATEAWDAGTLIDVFGGYTRRKAA